MTHLSPFKSSNRRRRRGGGGGHITLNYSFLLDSASTMAQVVLLGPTPVYTRASNAMSFDSAGNYAYAPHQLLENANMGSRAGDPLLPSGWSALNSGATIEWVDEPGGYASIKITQATDRHQIRNAVTVVNNETYSIGFHLDAIDDGFTPSDSVFDGIGTNGTDGEIQGSDLSGVGWYATGIIMGDTSVNITLGNKAGSDVGSMTFSRLFVIKGLLAGVSVGLTGVKLSGPPLGRWIPTDDGDEPKYDQPRFAHDPADSNARIGLLMEVQRTNLQINSEAFDDAGWGKTNITINADDRAAPDGNTTADRFTDDATDAFHRMFDQVTLTTGTDIALSIYARAGTKDFIFVNYHNSSEEFITGVFDISSGSTDTAASETDVGTTSGTIVSTHLENVGDGWFRCTLVGQIDDADGFFEFGTAEAATSNSFTTRGEPEYIGTSQTVHFWGAQAEAGAFHTSYIPTTTATVTRAKDVCGTTDLSWHSGGAGTWFAQWKQPVLLTGTDPYVFSINDGGVTDQVAVRLDNTTVRYFVTSSLGGDTNANLGSAIAGTVHKVAGAYQVDDSAALLDSGSLKLDATLAIPVGFSRLDIANRADGAKTLNGYCQILQYFGVRKPNAFLVSKTA